jgi:hypothetical protein
MDGEKVKKGKSTTTTRPRYKTFFWGEPLGRSSGLPLTDGGKEGRKGVCPHERVVVKMRGGNGKEEKGIAGSTPKNG